MGFFQVYSWSDFSSIKSEPNSRLISFFILALWSFVTYTARANVIKLSPKFLSFSHSRISSSIDQSNLFIFESSDLSGSSFSVSRLSRQLLKRAPSISSSLETFFIFSWSEIFFVLISSIVILSTSSPREIGDSISIEGRQSFPVIALILAKPSPHWEL